uniref:Uncharacterized protein n=1 Tax=Arundo donax TaxID=35708 RepID=A0A0A9FL58_ARUDO
MSGSAIGHVSKQTTAPSRSR